MRCSVTVKRRNRPRPCTHPAVVAYTVEGEPYSYCQHHHSQERQRFAAKYGIPSREVPA